MQDRLARTNFLNGMRFNPDLLAVSDKYYEDKFSILSLGGIGYGVLAGFKDSLMPSIEGNLLVIKSGACIDKLGNLIYLDKPSSSIIDNLYLSNFRDKTTQYIYIKFHENLEDRRADKNNTGNELDYKIVNSYEVVMDSHIKTSDEYLELGRISIDSAYGSNDKISLARNPFYPAKNEIDIRSVSKIKAKEIIGEDDILKMVSILKQFGLFTSELSYKIKLFSASSVSSFSYKICSDIKNDILYPWNIYDKVYDLLMLCLEIEKEDENIRKTLFWKNIERLKSLFDIRDDGIGLIDYYKLSLEKESSFFTKVFNHLKNASLFDKNWDELFSEPEEEIIEEKPKKDFVQVGRSAKPEHDNDLIISVGDISRIHLKISYYKGGYFIEDLSSANGTYINSVRLEANVRQFVRQDDKITLGKNATLLNLNEPVIQDLVK